MVSKQVFSTKRGAFVPPANDKNEAGGKAYAMSREHALAQYAVTGCLNGTFYASADVQLETVLDLAKSVTPEYLAKVAVYAREEGLMKDMPALLLAVLSTRDMPLTKRIFRRVCNDGKMLKNFVQIIRSGQVGRKSMGTAIKKLIQNWFAERTEMELFRASVGGDVSLSDLIKMVHPKPKDDARKVFYKYLIGKKLEGNEPGYLPAEILRLEELKETKKGVVPEVPFQLVTNLDLNKEQIYQVWENMSWHQLRQSLNWLSKHDLFKDASVANKTAIRLAHAGEVRRAKAFPFQLFTAYMATKGNPKVPPIIANALQDAMEVSLGNVPELQGKVLVAVDNSGSMSTAATGDRGSATSVVSCLNVASLMGSALLRRNPNSVKMIAFNTTVVDAQFNPRDSVMTNTEALGRLPGGGTDCSVVLRMLNAEKVQGIDSIIYLSDYESWVDGSPGSAFRAGTPMLHEWTQYKTRNPNAKLICIDIAPNRTAQTTNRGDILNVGGFSDNVFKIVDLFLKNDLTESHWVSEISKLEI